MRVAQRSQVQLGSHVIWNPGPHDNKNPLFTGVVRFIGFTKFRPGVWFGIEVDDERGMPTGWGVVALVRAILCLDFLVHVVSFCVWISEVEYGFL